MHTDNDTDTAALVKYSVSGRRWRDSSGNTYHTARVWITGMPGSARDLPVAYGYGRHYLTTATEWLGSQGVAVDYRDLRDEGAVDVRRKRDL